MVDHPRKESPRETAPKRPTDAELGILRVLWSRGPSTVREVHAELSKLAPTGYTTVLKLMQIMTDKGLVERDESSRAHVYSTGQPRQQVQRGLIGHLLDRAFEGSASQLVQQALATRPASAQELAEIRSLLDEAERSATEASDDNKEEPNDA